MKIYITTLTILAAILACTASLPAAVITWNNTGGTGDGTTWDIATNQNWNNGAPTTYSDGDAVTFNNTNNGNFAVSIPGSVAPSSITFSNDSTTNTYTLTVAGGQTLGGTGAYTQGVAPSGATNTVTNVVVTGGGTFNVTSSTNTNFAVGVGAGSNTPTGQPQASLDMSGLANFVFSTGTGYFGVGNLVTRPTSTVRLANTSNSITAATLGVGDSNQAGGNNSGGTSTLFLGAGTNTINVNTFNVGLTKSPGVVDWQTANGSVNILGEAGGAATTNITVGRQSSASGSNTPSKFLLAGHSATVQAGSVQIGVLAGATAGTDNGSLTFDAGNFGATNFSLAVDSSGSAPNGATGTFTLGGPTPNNTATGVLNVSTSFFLANVTNTSTAAKTDKGSFIINGGSASIASDILVNKVAAATGTTVTTTFTLAGGTLDMNNKAIAPVSGTNIAITNVNLPAATQTAKIKNLGGTGINGAGLTMNGGGTLILDGVNAYTGTTNITVGTILLDGSNTGGGTIAVSAGATLGGKGSTTGLVTVAATGNVSPGDSINTLGVGSATIAGALNIELNDADPKIVDVLNDAGTLDLTAATSTVNFLVTGTPTAPAYVFAKYGVSGLGGTFGTVNNLPSGYNIDYNYLGGNQIALVAVPEPAGIALAAMGLAGMLSFVRSRRNQSMARNTKRR